MSARSPKYMRVLQAFADDVAAAIGVQLAITTEDGAVELATSAASTGVHPSIPPIYDPVICRLVWPARESTSVGSGAPFHLPDGSKRLLWTSCIIGKACDPPTIARLFQQHLVDLQQHRNEVDDLAAQLLETYEEMHLFYELADAFEVASDDTQVGSILLTRALEATSAQGGAVVLLQDSTPTVVAAVGALSAPLTRHPLQSFPLLETTLQSGIAHNLGGQKIPDAGQPDRPTMIAPVLIKRTPVGALVLQKSAEDPFAAGEMMLARSLSTHAGVFLNNLRQARRLVDVARLQQQVEFAQTVQRQLLPAMDREIAGLDIAVAYLASNQVGGDYYDIFDIAPHTMCAVIADVSGHSIASGLLMTAARSALRLLVRHESQPAKILQQLNDTLYRDLDQTDLFISLFLVMIDLEAEVMRYASAGHNPALLYRCASHHVMPLEATGFLMGFLPDASFDEIAQPFQRGDALVLYTDGITEARNAQGEFFGEARLQAQVRHIGDAEARGIVGSIMIDVRQHTQARLDDDMTLLVLKLAA